ncbi:MAG: hypothetical protein AAF721_26415 [Myxococcota bacterium]
MVRQAICGAALLLGSGCDAPGLGEVPPSFAEPEFLVFNGDWRDQVDGDPFPEHRPAEVDCTVDAHVLEHTALELSTAECNYFYVEASTLTGIAPGDRITVRAFHDDLAALEPADAHLALSIDGNVVWDEEIAIPSPATPYTVTVTADFGAPPGSPVGLHLHNHGLNTYRLLDVRAEALD